MCFWTRLMQIVFVWRARGTDQEQPKGQLHIMYSRGFNYNRPPYPVAPHETHNPPPLSHPPCVYGPPSRFSYNAYPTVSSYQPSSSASYSHIPPQLTHYADPRYMEMSPREEAPVLHHLPQHPSTLDPRPEHPHQVMEGSAQLLPSCEQGNQFIWCFHQCFLKITPS